MPATTTQPMTAEPRPDAAGALAVETVSLRKEFIRGNGKKRRFGRRRRVAALKNVSFSMERGETLAILGQNGSGKSTLVRLLSTLLLHEGGTARIFGHDVFKEPRTVRRLVNRVSVEASFFKKMSAAENLSYAARFYGMSARQTRRQIPDILERVGTQVVTLGPDGVRVERKGEDTIVVPAVPEARRVEPTGVGDAFRAGFLAALEWGLGHERAAQLGCLLAVYVVERVGTQEYVLERRSFLDRLASAYGDEAAAEIGEHLVTARP